MAACENRFAKGLRDGVPIALGYLSVSFTFGIHGVDIFFLEEDGYIDGFKVTNVF